VAFYLYELAGLFIRTWNKGRDEPRLRFVNDKNDNHKIGRLGFGYAVRVCFEVRSSITELTLQRENCARTVTFPHIALQNLCESMCSAMHG